jgi:hypothetical protein
MINDTCPKCAGTGRVEENTCSACEGLGALLKNHFHYEDAPLTDLAKLLDCPCYLEDIEKAVRVLQATLAEETDHNQTLTSFAEKIAELFKVNGIPYEEEAVKKIEALMRYIQALDYLDVPDVVQELRSIADKLSAVGEVLQPTQPNPPLDLETGSKGGSGSTDYTFDPQHLYDVLKISSSSVTNTTNKAR